MAAEFREQSGGKVIIVRVTDKLSKDDYRKFVPEIERLIDQYGKIRILFEMLDFHGWEAGALWEDIKFDVRHFGDIERLALVGETKWEQRMSAFCKPFTRAKIRYFDVTQSQQADEWIMAGIGTTA